MDVRDRSSVEAAVADYRPDVFIHAAAVLDGTRLSAIVETNIVGTANVVLACARHRVKLLYISTDYVYPNEMASHGEDDPLLPSNSYAWTKLGGECAVRTYPNSLIVRGAVCVRPYPHATAYTDVRKNMIYQDKAAGHILDLLGATGVVNVGEDNSTSLYEFAKLSRPDVQPAISPADYEPKRSHLRLDRLKRRG